MNEAKTWHHMSRKDFASIEEAESAKDLLAPILTASADAALQRVLHDDGYELVEPLSLVKLEAVALSPGDAYLMGQFVAKIRSTQ